MTIVKQEYKIKYFANMAEFEAFLNAPEADMQWQLHSWNISVTGGHIAVFLVTEYGEI